MNTTPALSLNKVIKRYSNVEALCGLSLSIPVGQIYGLLGANGAGKTTALRIICGLVAPDSGELTGLAGLRGVARRQLGYVPQRGGLYDDLSVIENLRFRARAYALAQPASLVNAALQEHGLTERSQQRVGNLSGGWRQRVALAAAMLHQPKLMLLDEPTAGLDAEAREQLWQRLRANAARGVTQLITSHYAEEAERCDRIGYLGAGHLLAEGVPAKFAEMLGIAVWRLGVEHGPPPTIRGSRISRDSAGWRIVVAADIGIPAPLAAWCCERAIQLELIAPRLTDALHWITDPDRTRP